ncbi:MAG: hypothetical protein NZM35_05820 [Chitinophagales bacterium]|nr:hypothetical protein [Chitinophagales bacterium]MDW8419960.1 hypothetical protein [Chitinophagales bacterium]
MMWHEVIGQQEIKQGLVNMVQSGKLPHALLLLGPEGCGNLALAIALARYLHCENRNADSACGACPSCHKYGRFIHPDCYFTYPVVKSEKQTSPPISADYITEWRNALAENPYLTYPDWMQIIRAENKQGNITARECRQIIQQLHLKTFEGSHKIQIIWLPEFLGNEGNILLKILEEPPPYTHFILVSENADNILTTILSRVQIIKVPPISDPDLSAYLQQHYETDAEAALRIARIAEGNLCAALQICEGKNNANDRVLRQWLLLCYQLRHKPTATGFSELTRWLDEFSASGRENQKVFIRYALYFIRECVAILATGSSAKLFGEELNFATKFTARLDVESLEQIQILFNQLHYHIERNANPKILFMSASWQIADILTAPVAAS